MTNAINRELEKNRNDKIAGEAELDVAKKRFAEEMLNNNSIYNIKSALNYKPQKYKKPLRMRLKRRIKRFFLNIIEVLGN